MGYRNALICCVTVLCMMLAVSAQTSDPAGPQQSQVEDKPGNIIGTILDQSGSVTAGAVVHLTSEDKSFSKEVVSGDNGQFSFSNVPAGHFNISVNSAGFGDKAFSGELASGQTYLMPPIVLSIATVVTSVRVAVDPVEVATEEVKEEEHQRIFGFIPNFYVTYHEDAAPLTTKLKFRLAYKSTTDAVTIAGTAFLAGLQQAGDQWIGLRCCYQCCGVQPRGRLKAVAHLAIQLDHVFLPFVLSQRRIESRPCHVGQRALMPELAP